jgi:hypothetical protein
MRSSIVARTRSPEMVNASTGGEARRDEALQAHDRGRPDLLLGARRALLEQLLVRPVATMDDVAEALSIPPDFDARCFGAAFPPLARWGIVKAVGWARSKRRSRSAGSVQQWELVNRALALEWLANNPQQSFRQRSLPGVE